MPQNICDNPFVHEGEVSKLSGVFKPKKTGKDMIMKWYRDLYLGEGLKQNKEKLVKKAETCAGMPNIYVITLAANGRDLLDIFLADLLIQPVLHGRCPLIVGMAKGRREAVRLASDIVMEAYRANGDFDILKFLRERTGDGGAMVCEYPAEHLKKRRRSGFGK